MQSRDDAARFLGIGIALTGRAMVVAISVPTDGATAPDDRSRRASAPLVTGERYEVIETIGRGGMGEVMSAHDAQIGREVAIKRMHADLPTPGQTARFLREARIQGRLEHPAIPPVHELATDDDGRPYFVMKKLAGVTLAEILRDPSRHPAFSRQRLLRAFVEVCHAIELAHSKRIVHRDLKPGNVLLGERGEVYVIDWGIACELDRPESPLGPILGTVGYMAPEHRAGATDIDERVDVYALGCVLHEILTGQPRNPRRELALPVTPPVEVPPELEKLCHEATALDRAFRMSTVRELGDAVQRYLDGDRDIERRRELAWRHYSAAQAALLEKDEAVRRQTAMREAGRALALDPTLHAAAELVGRLMMVPPTRLPDPVVSELAALDRVEDARQLRLATVISGLYLAALPVLIAFGVRDVPYIIAYAVISLGCFWMQLGATLSPEFLRRTALVEWVFCAAQIGLLARIFTPLLVAPGLGAVTVMGYAMTSVARRPRVIVSSVLVSMGAVLGVWAAELVGLVSKTTWISGGTIVMRSPLEGIDSFPTAAGLVFYIVSLFVAAASVSHSIARRAHQSRAQVQLQAWQLRQLL